MFATATQAQNIPSYVPTNGLVGWWPFNGNANDESGNGNHGTVNGATLTSDRNGVAGKAYSFDGNNCINVPNPYTSQSFSISIWVNSNENNISGGTMYHQGVNEWGISKSNLNNGIRYISGSVKLSDYNWYGSPGIQLVENVWNHVIVTYTRGDRIKVYINSNLVDSSILIPNLGFWTGWINTASIGAYNCSSSFYNGKLDDIAIYNRALTQSEITALYNSPITYNCTSSSSFNGFITPIGTNIINKGASQRYTFTSNTGYVVDSVIVDGTKVDSLQGYTFSNISANHSIRVTFKIDSNNVSMNFPTGISYQAIARDSAGKVLANSPIKLRFSIKENSMNGNTVYTETANLTTNKLGLFNCVIGNNNATYGNYKNIDWMGATKYLQVELEQGNSFVLLGTQQLLSVPYANAAKEATKIKNAALPIYNSNSDALQGGLKPGEMYRTNAGILMIVY